MINQPNFSNDDSHLISSQRQRKLRELEQGIKSNLRALSEMVRNLNEVDRLHLWREGHGSFKRYCSQKWAIDDRLVFMLHEMLDLDDTHNAATTTHQS